MKKNNDRSKAIAENRKTYSGVICKHCGTSEKYVSNYACVECISRNSSENNRKSYLKRKASGTQNTAETKERKRQIRKRYYEKNGATDNEKRRTRRLELGSEYISVALTALRGKSKKRNIPFDLEVSDVVIPEVCPVFGTKLKMNLGGAQDDSPSFDRINPVLGYVKGNVRVISNKANRIKSNATPEEIRMVYEYSLENWRDL
jgi:hypothetical protein